jgi:hypothetical protein
VIPVPSLPRGWGEPCSCYQGSLSSALELKVLMRLICSRLTLYSVPASRSRLSILLIGCEASGILMKNGLAIDLKGSLRPFRMFDSFDEGPVSTTSRWALS